MAAGLFVHCGGEVVTGNGTGDKRDSGTGTGGTGGTSTGGSGTKNDASVVCVRADGVTLREGETTTCPCVVGLGRQTCVGGVLSICSCSAQTPVCGNNIVEGIELCDGTNLQNESCSTVSMMALPFGSLACTRTCVFDTSGCFGNGGAGGIGGMMGQGATFGAGGFMR